ncbi:GNAT family N-acetyltransferase [Vibrio sp. SCSIO 43132]|uniref:GNAT family N-acetyltransferase n=1 Tax=Vibrio sp. SCSIO 43132 TaxID=2779363 RepID=UPI001CA89B67|nr:GNAT family N-acetyltransferase [Vibrio sp. SCSIO 43132]UAB71460.1 GNAT family N-acetyltransferase [Vibrio sp. SCSIO 43132]
MERWLTHEYSAALFKYDNETLGYVLWRDHADFVYVRQFFICDKFRKRGFGGRAFKVVKEEYWNSKRLRLEVLVHNKRALGFWKSVGFNEYSVTLEQEK